MNTYQLTRGIPRNIGEHLDVLLFEVDATNISIAKRCADELAIAVGEHRGRYIRFDDRKRPIPVAPDWALAQTNKKGQMWQHVLDITRA